MNQEQPPAAPSRSLIIARRVLNWLPVAIVIGAVAYSLYAYIYVTCLTLVEEISKQVVFISGYFLFLGLFSWSYTATIFTKVPPIPPRFYLDYTAWQRINKTPPKADDRKSALNTEVALAAQTLGIRERSHAADESWPCRIRFCENSRHIKPDRTRFCSACGKCVAKFDHHCPWVNNCVFYGNYKFFVLFLFYGSLFGIWCGFTGLPYFIAFWSDESLSSIHAVIFTVLTFFFTFMIGGLFCLHFFLLMKNRTTVEMSRAPVFETGADRNGYNLGAGENFHQVFGDRPVLWLFPVCSSQGDGFYFPRNERVMQV